MPAALKVFVSTDRSKDSNRKAAAPWRHLPWLLCKLLREFGRWIISSTISSSPSPHLPVVRLRFHCVNRLISSLQWRLYCAYWRRPASSLPRQWKSGKRALSRPPTRALRPRLCHSIFKQLQSCFPVRQFSASVSHDNNPQALEFTQMGSAPYLAETNPAPFGIETGVVPAQSIQTQIPIAGAQGALNDSIFYYMGNLRYATGTDLYKFHAANRRQARTSQVLVSVPTSIPSHQERTLLKFRDCLVTVPGTPQAVLESLSSVPLLPILLQTVPALHFQASCLS